MGEVVWVEILSSHRDVLSRQRCELDDGGDLFLGRAYDNHVLVDDPFVAPRHVRISRDESGRLVAEDVGTLNGMFLDHEATRRSRLPLDDDVPIRIGRTWLRVREASAAVAPEREALRLVRTWPGVALFTALLVGLTLLETWVEDSGESKLSTYVFPMFLVGAFVVSWTAAWAVLARIFAGKASFDRHAYVATLGLLVTSVVTWGAAHLAYSLSLPGLSVVESFGFWVWVSTLSFFHLREIGPKHLVVKGAVVGSFALLGIGGQLLLQAEAGGLISSQVGISSLKPPFLRMAGPQSEQDFFDGASALQSALDRARTEESPSGGLFSDFDLDD